MAIHDNLKLLLKELNLSQRQFAQALCLDPGYLSRIISGKTPLNSRLQLLIENTFKVNGEWLRTGKGPIFSVSSDSAIKSMVLAKVDKLDESQLVVLDSFLEYLIKAGKSDASESKENVISADPGGHPSSGK
jgi:transcriptional regulator with XRE-family HTH domain